MKKFSRKHTDQDVAMRVVLIVMALVVILVGTSEQSYSKALGPCSNCHTMYNSSDDGLLNFDDTDIPDTTLITGTCYGCHAQGGPNPTIKIGHIIVPQVMHSGKSNLAGGNFGYITGLVGSGAADNKGHNISGLTGADYSFPQNSSLPGRFKENVHDESRFNARDLRCAGNNGCHAYRNYEPGTTLRGVHHNNVDGQLNQATEPGNSYRFLMGVKGFESSDWQENPTIENHNEYFGLSTPVQLGCSAVSCHNGPGRLVQSPNGTMSQFCATCHGNFHTLATGDSDGIGSTATSPFIRHPTDLSLPSTGEFGAFTVYNLDAPVARLNVPDAASSVVTPGEDAVMCLTCHVAHASNYPDMLRWDYTGLVAGKAGTATGNGCFICHSGKE